MGHETTHSDEKPAPSAPRVEPQAGATRCPYCHDGCAPEADVAVCRTCLSRHHAECWSEGGACASCGASDYLDAPESREAAQPVVAEAPGVGKRDVGLWVLLVGTSALLLGMVQASQTFLQMFEEVGVDLPALTKLCLAPAGHPFLASLGVVAWVVAAALARQRRKVFVGVVLTGTLLAIPIMVLGLFLPLIQIF